jgi:glutaredoxin
MQTKKEFDKRGIRYEEMQLENHPDMLEQFKLEGLMAAPIIVTDIKKWSGFRLEKIKSLESYLKDEPKKSSLNLDQKFDVAIGLLMDDNLVWDDDFELIRKELAELISSKRGLGASNHPSVLAIIEKLVKEE